MKMNKNLFIFLLLFFIVCNAMEEPLNLPKHIVVDYSDFLIEHDITTAIKQIGIWSIGPLVFGALLSGGFQPIVDNFFETLSTINPQDPPTPTMWQQQKAPYILYESLTGKKTTEVILNEAITGIKKQKLHNESLMLKYADLTFNPKVHTKIMKTVAEAISLLQELKNQGHTIHLLGNSSKEIALKLAEKLTIKQKNKSINLINGTMLFSCNIGMVKSPAMYNKFFEETKAPPNDTIFIETEKSYLENLTQLDCYKDTQPKSILFLNKDFLALRQKLIEFGALHNK